ncbi:MAG: hypothetical protein AAGF97_01280 [Planctomycetota bacterium]
MHAQRQDAEVNMSKNSLIRWFFLVVAAAAIAGLPVSQLSAQSSTRADLPGVELPAPTNEAEPFPDMNDIVPPSVTDGSYQDTIDAPGDEEPYGLEPMPSGSTMDGPMMGDPTGMGPMQGQPIYEDGYGYDGYPGLDNQVFDGSELDFPAGGAYSGEDAPVPIYSTGTWFKRGDVFFDFGYVFLMRENPRNVPILQDQSVIVTPPGQAPTFLTYNNNELVSHKFEPGVRLSVGYFLGRDVARRDHQIEFGFVGLVEWSDFRRVTSALDVDSMFTVLADQLSPNAAGLVNNRSQTFQYDTEFNSFEANYRLRTRPGRDVLAMQPNGAWVRHGVDSVVREFFVGLRGVNFDELVDYRGFDANGAQQGRLGVMTNNDLFGVQAGLESIVKHDSWSWGIKGRSGLLANFAQRRSNLSDTTGTLLSQDLTEEDLTFNFEVGSYGSYQLRPNLHFKAGYDFMFFTGLALAPENLTFTSGFSELNTQGWALLHGGTIAFETTW